MQNERDAFVTMLIDFYGIKDYHQFPEWEKCETITNKNERVDCLESAMKKDIEDMIRWRFIPYIQLHEFEALLLNKFDVYEQNFQKSELKNIVELKRLTNIENPEMINSDNPPSKRLSELISRYNKILYGACIAASIGLDNIRSKCPRFNNWIETLEKICKE